MMPITMTEIKLDMFDEKMAVSDAGSSGNNQWTIPLTGKKMPKSELMFFVQVLLIYIVVLTSIVNLTINADNGKLWTALLSSSLGYLLPNPSLRKRPDKDNKNGE
jgi:hypothetical protein